MTGNHEAVIRSVEVLVKEHMSRYDPSHDWYHVNRVRNTALRIARSLTPQPDLRLTELLALCHDLDDHKYSQTGSLAQTLAPLLGGCFDADPGSDLSDRKQGQSSDGKITQAVADRIIALVPLISWSTEKRLRSEDKWDGLIDSLDQGEKDVLFAVQDADRLDAIGAFGILRVAAYSSATSRPLHVPPLNFPSTADPSNAAPGVASNQKQINESAIQHFHDKLLLVKDRMKTDWGKREAENRHQTMVEFLAAIDNEYGQ